MRCRGIVTILAMLVLVVAATAIAALTAASADDLRRTRHAGDAAQARLYLRAAATALPAGRSLDAPPGYDGGATLDDQTITATAGAVRLRARVRPDAGRL